MNGKKRSRGNQTDYQAKSDRGDREEKEEQAWRYMQATSPLAGSANDRGALIREKLSAKATKVSDVALALEVLARVTGDDAFATASLALASYGLDDTGLETALLRLLDTTGNTVADFVKPMAPRGRARQTAIELGLPGATLNGVAEKIVRRPVTPTRSWPEGDTGRKLRVRLAMPIQGADGTLQNTLNGVTLYADALAEVPDNQVWRRYVRLGIVALHGISPSASPDLGIF